MTPTDIMILWNFVLSVVVGIVSFVIRDKFDEIHRVSILINKTREEIARDNVTKAELERMLNHMDQRFTKLEVKIDELIRQNHA